MPDSLPTRWEPDRAQPATPWPLPKLPVALLRGLKGRCPGCGETRMFTSFLRVVPQCAQCGAPLGLARADDAPPYFTILIVGHVVIPSMYLLERAYSPPFWLQALIWLPVTAGLSLALLQPIKGATVGLMLKFGMLKSEIDE